MHDLHIGDNRHVKRSNAVAQQHSKPDKVFPRHPFKLVRHGFQFPADVPCIRKDPALPLPISWHVDLLRREPRQIGRKHQGSESHHNDMRTPRFGKILRQAIHGGEKTVIPPTQNILLGFGSCLQVQIGKPQRIIRTSMAHSGQTDIQQMARGDRRSFRRGGFRQFGIATTVVRVLLRNRDAYFRRLRSYRNLSGDCRMQQERTRTRNRNSGNAARRG